MKIIDAYWEKRNLGVDSKEFVLEDSDTVESLSAIKDSMKSVGYMVVKVPVARLDIYEELSRLGFVYVESSVHFQVKLHEAQLTPLQERLNAAVSYEEMDSSDLEQLYKELDNGLFDTDRIVLDPYFSKEQAAIRYRNWINDELSKGTKVYKIVYKKEAIGFFTFKKTAPGVFYPFLAGLYKNHTAGGLGFSIIRKPIEEAIKRGGSAISTYVSSNNLPVVRVHLQQGFVINDIKNIFVKHN